VDDVVPTPTVVPTVISNLLITTDTDNAIVTWDTNQDSSSEVNYGVNLTTENFGGETDVLPETTSHSVTLDNLVSCSTYVLEVVSRSSQSSVATSASVNFTTKGCPGDSLVVVGVQQTVPLAVSQTVSLIGANANISLDIGTSTTSLPVTYEIQHLDKNSVVSVLGVPASMQLVGSHVYELKALADAFTEVTVFNRSIPITISYSNSEISGLDSDQAWIYGHDGVNWSRLDNCQRNSTNRTIICPTSHFSLFGLFARPIETVTNSNSNSGSSGGSSGNGGQMCNDSPPMSIPELYKIETNRNTATLIFTPAAMPVSYYYVRFGTKPNVYLYGAEFKMSYSSGSIRLPINQLKAHTKYYFQVRAGNGCTPGEWSNRMWATTTWFTRSKATFNYFNQRPKPTPTPRIPRS